jgi:anti-sigma factor RsiW
MKAHPTPEEWMSFLYGEVSPARHAELGAHLQGCAGCRRQVQTWRGSMSALDAWTAPQPLRRRVSGPVMRWAAAAVVVLSVGFGAGRMSSSTDAQIGHVAAALRSEMDAKLASTREAFAQSLEQQRTGFAEAVHAAAIDASGEEAEQMFARLARLVEETRVSDQQAYLAALKQVEERYAALRQDLDTVAVNADDGLSQTREQLVEIAALAQRPNN